MSDNENCLPLNKRTPWNKGKLIGARPPLRPKHVWSIRTRLLLEGRIRDLALFNLAIDSKLRGCDVVAVRSRTLPQTVIRWTARRCGKRRQDGRSSLNCGSDPPSHRRLHEGCGQETGRISIRGSALLQPLHDHSTIRAAPFGMDRQYRARLKAVSHAFASANKGNANLPSNRKSTGGTALARSHKNRNTVRYLGIEVDDALAIAEQVDV